MVPIKASCGEEPTIYNIIPPEIPTPVRPPIYKSKHNPLCPPTASTFGVAGTSLPGLTNLAGGESETLYCRNANHKPAGTMGVLPGKLKPNPNAILKKQEQAKTVEDLATLRSKQPELFLTKKKHTLKPAVPNRNDKPLMNLVSDKNFVTANAVDVILATPSSCRATGDASSNDYKLKHEYGKVPSYLSKVKEDIQREYEYVRRLQSADTNPQIDGQQSGDLVMLPDEERLSLIAALKEKWTKLNNEYQATTHIVKLDTIGKVKRKEFFESTLMRIEKDIEKLSRKFVFVSHQ